MAGDKRHSSSSSRRKQNRREKSEASPTLGSALSHAWAYAWRIGRSYDAHRCGLMACACAYCAMLSMVPLLVIGIAGFGFFLGGSAPTTNRIVHAIEAYSPRDPGFADSVRSLLSHVLHERRVLGIVGIIGLTWASHQVFLSLLQAMNVVFNAKETRRWWRQRMIGLVSAVVTLIVLMATFFVVASFARLEDYLGPHVPAILRLSFNRVTATIIPVLLLWCLFTLLYRVMPNCEVKPGSAALGAGVAAILWQLSLTAFGAYLRHYNSYDRVYGSLAGLVIVVVWCYYSMAILLLGGEISSDRNSSGLQINDPHKPVDSSIS